MLNNNNNNYDDDYDYDEDDHDDEDDDDEEEEDDEDDQEFPIEYRLCDSRTHARIASIVFQSCSHTHVCHERTHR